ncbi:hypothetical protein ACFPRL_25175 [Pseudoclavibacter helvolus]
MRSWGSAAGEDIDVSIPGQPCQQGSCGARWVGSRHGKASGVEPRRARDEKYGDQTDACVLTRSRFWPDTERTRAECSPRGS